MKVRNKNFYDILINLIRKLGEKETVVKLGDSNGHAEVTEKNIRTIMEVIAMKF